MSHAPDDDALLVLADELQLAGDPRGELIGIQVELERGGGDRARRIALRRRERDLLSRHGEAWANLEGLAFAPRFRRGFVDEAIVDVRTFVSRRRELWAVAPRLRRLRFTGLEHRATLLGSAPDPSDAREVCYWVEHIVADPRVTNVELIDPIVSWSRIRPQIEHQEYVTAAVVEWLVSSRSIESLTGLQLPHVSVAAFTKLRPYGGLKDLRLEHDMDDERECANCGELRPRRLALTGTALGRRHPQVVMELLRTSIVDDVVDLELSSLAPYDALLIGGRPFAKQLKKLRGGIFDYTRKLPLLTNARELAALEELVLSGTAEPDLTALHDPAALESLRVLRLGCEPNAEEVLRLLDSPLGRRLEALDLRPAKPELATALALCGWDGVLYV